ncbi:MAG: hypothetical protein PHE54_01655 [Bacilli bacterium]|nr:hypothetical protein [Bacilli bacterium]
MTIGIVRNVLHYDKPILKKYYIYDEESDMILRKILIETYGVDGQLQVIETRAKRNDVFFCGDLVAVENNNDAITIQKIDQIDLSFEQLSSLYQLMIAEKKQMEDEGKNTAVFQMLQKSSDYFGIEDLKKYICKFSENANDRQDVLRKLANIILSSKRATNIILDKLRSNYHVEADPTLEQLFSKVVEKFTSETSVNSISINSWFTYFALYQMVKKGNINRQTLNALGNALLNARVINIKLNSSEESFLAARIQLYADFIKIEDKRIKKIL